MSLNKLKAGRKPNSVIRRLRRRTVTIYLDRPSPVCSSHYHEGTGPSKAAFIFVLLRTGLAELPALPPELVSSYLTVSP